MTDTSGADERRREQARIRKEYPDLYYYAVGVALVVTLMLVGYVVFPDRDSYVTNLFTEAASVAVTLLVLNRMAEARERRRYKQDLIFRMGSQVNAEAVRAAEELRRHEWLCNGSLNGANLHRANLKGADLVGADLKAVILRFANLEEANLRQAHLAGADLVQARLKNAELPLARLEGARMGGANLDSALLLLAHLEGANLVLASLEGANLTNAYLQGARLEAANLKGAKLQDVRLTEDTNLAGAILPNGERWRPGYDMSIFTDPPSEDDSA